MKASVSLGFPNTRKPMKSQGGRPSAFIVFECLETLGVCSKIMMFTMGKVLKNGSRPGQPFPKHLAYKVHPGSG